MTLMVKPDHAALYFLERLGKSKAPASSGANPIEKLGVFSLYRQNSVTAQLAANALRPLC
jgi:hypothetical protein